MVNQIVLAGFELKALEDIDVTPAPITRLFIGTLLKQKYSILVMLFGIVIVVKLVQSLNVLPPRVVRPFPIITDVKPLQPKNASLPMLVTLLGMVTDVKPLQP